MPSTGLTSTEVTVDGAAVNVDPGYYLIVAKDGKDASSKLALVTTDVTMVEKNTYIDTGKKTAQTSYNVGDIVTYTATVVIPADTALTQTDNAGLYLPGHGPITLHDKMDSRLTFQEITGANVGDVAFAASAYTLDPNPSDGDTFDIVIPVTDALRGETITFTYTAMVNETAVDPDTGFINDFGGDLNGYKTIPDKPVVYTFDFDFSKTFVGSQDSTLVAKFVLYSEEEYAKVTDNNDQTTGTPINFKAGQGAGNYIKAATGGDPTITSTNNAAINIQGLKAGTYYLVETETSTGYNLLDGPAVVVITDTTPKDDNGNITGTISHTVTIDGSSSTAEDPVKIENRSGTVLPSTGGIGTTIFYVVGALMMAAAVVLLITKKRVGNVK
jgi:fimbrial isopeptide formation D2 family protein/LPXTG-motif cell wall-anchored protein